MVWLNSASLNAYSYRNALRKMVVLIVISLGGCAGFEIEEHSIQYNQAVGSLGNRLLLLNAVRAAQDYPMQFSKLAAYTGQGRGKGSLGIEIPFGVNKVGVGALSPDLLTGSLNPTIELNSGVNSFQLVDLNTAEAQRALRTQPGVAEYEYYLTQGWPPRIATTIMIEMIAVRAELVEIMSKKYLIQCQADPTRGDCTMYEPFSLCQDEAKKKKYDLKYLGSEPYEYKGVQYINFFNKPLDRCRFVGFQVLFDSFRVSRGAFDLLLSAEDDSASSGGDATKKQLNYTVDVNVNVAEVKPAKSKVKREIPVYFGDEEVADVYKNMPEETASESELGEQQKKKKKSRRNAFEIVFRSPERMVRFLGEIVAVQILYERTIQRFPWGISGFGSSMSVAARNLAARLPYP